MSYGVEIEFTDGPMARREMKRLPLMVNVAAGKTIDYLTNMFYAEVKKEYLSGQKRLGGKRPNDSTIEKRRFAKGQRYVSEVALLRSGRLMDLVTTSRYRSKKTQTNRVFIRPAVRLPGGTGISDKVATMNEFGAGSITFEVTSKMRRYLHALLDRSGRREEVMRRREGEPAALTITINIPRRSVWMPVIQRTMVRQPGQFVRIFAKELQMRTKFNVKWTI